MTSAVDVSLRPLLRPVELTQDETQRLIHAFIKGKTEVLEEDCMTLIKWAMAQRLGALMVEWMIEGSIRPVVVGSDVLVEAISAT
jgi:hypothetical protein